MSYVLRGLGKHQYQAPIVTGGLGIRYIFLPGGIVIGRVSNRYAVIISAGSYPILAHVAAMAVEVQIAALRTLTSITALLVRAGVLNQSSSDLSAQRIESDVEEDERVD